MYVQHKKKHRKKVHSPVRVRAYLSVWECVFYARLIVYVHIHTPLAPAQKKTGNSICHKAYSKKNIILTIAKSIK